MPPSTTEATKAQPHFEPHSSFQTDAKFDPPQMTPVSPGHGMLQLASGAAAGKTCE
jgi:hypothetical protein